MARFRFRLDSYLGLKEKLESRRKQEYGHALAELEREKAEKERLARLAEDNLRRFRADLEKEVNPPLVQSFNNFADVVKKMIQEQDKKIRKAEAEAEEKRLQLVEAVREKKALEILKEKALEEFNREEKLAEQKSVDEVVSYRFNIKEDA